MKKKYWHDTRLPAELFFEILQSGKFKKLIIKGKPSKGELRKAWSKIFDEYFTIKDDTQLKEILRVKKNILKSTLKIQTIEASLKIFALGKLNKETTTNIVNKLKEIGVFIDLKKSLNEEVLRILKTHLAGLKTSLQLEEHQLKELTKGATTTFEDNCVNIEQCLGRSITENVSLRKYLAYEAQAKRISIERKKRKK